MSGGVNRSNLLAKWFMDWARQIQAQLGHQGYKGTRRDTRDQRDERDERGSSDVGEKCRGEGWD